MLESDFGVDARRVLEVLAGFGEDLRDELFASDGGAQARVYRCVGPLHDGEDGVGDAAGIVVRIFLPGANDFEFEQVGADVVEQDGVVGGGSSVESGGVDGGELLLEVVERGDFFLDAAAE